jgi:hypothetical protein
VVKIATIILEIFGVLLVAAGVAAAVWRFIGYDSLAVSGVILLVASYFSARREGDS